MKNKVIKFAFVLTILFTMNSIGTKIYSQSDNFIIGKWKMEKSTFNEKDSPVPEGVIMEFHSDKRITMLIPNSNNTGKTLKGQGKWLKENKRIKITWNEPDLFGTELNWTILELTKSKLIWKSEMNGGIQREKLKKIK